MSLLREEGEGGKQHNAQYDDHHSCGAAGGTRAGCRGTGRFIGRNRNRLIGLSGDLWVRRLR
jgi:hypothetical protein